MMTEHSTSPAASLSAALGIDGGMVCTVGAGGKKSLLYALAKEATGRIGVTATVTTFPFPRWLQAQIVVADEATLQRQLTQPGGPGVVAYACPPVKHARRGGLATTTVADIHTRGGFDLTLIKADGARMRGIKAPRIGEPVLPQGTARVLALVSANVIGQSLSADVAHRPQLLAEVLGADFGKLLTAEHVGRLLAAERGALQATGSVPIVPVLNQGDTDGSQQQGPTAGGVVLAH